MGFKNLSRTHTPANLQTAWELMQSDSANENWIYEHHHAPGMMLNDMQQMCLQTVITFKVIWCLVYASHSLVYNVISIIQSLNA